MVIAKMSSPLSAVDEGTHSLSERINLSTRSTHAQLNRLIIACLPLALPPYTSDSSTYTSGLLHIAPIYITFELLWQVILAPCLLKTPGSEAVQHYCDWEQTPSDLHRPAFLSDSQQLLLAHQAKRCSKTNCILGSLLLPGLLRSERLRSDIKTLSGRSDEEIGEQLRDISQNGAASNFIEHTTKAVIANPHVLLAYTWVFYMALFSGGRYIRASLQRAGPEFWSRSSSHTHLDLLPEKTIRSETSRSLDETDSSDIKSSLDRVESSSESLAAGSTPGLQFFHFDGEEDGEDIKREFKKRFAEADMLLSEGEKDDIVQEAQHIFTSMVTMVGELDRICGSAGLTMDHAKMTEQAEVQDRDGPSIIKERKQSSQPKEQSTRIPRSEPAVSRTFRLRATSSTAELREIGQVFRKATNPFSRRSSGASKFMTGKGDQAPFGVFEFCIDDLKAASVFTVPILISMFVAWYLF